MWCHLPRIQTSNTVSLAYRKHSDFNCNRGTAILSGRIFNSPIKPYCRWWIMDLCNWSLRSATVWLERHILLHALVGPERYTFFELLFISDPHYMVSKVHRQVMRFRCREDELQKIVIWRAWCMHRMPGSCCMKDRDCVKSKTAPCMQWTSSYSSFIRLKWAKN